MTPELLAIIKGVKPASDEDLEFWVNADDTVILSFVARIVEERKVGAWQNISTAPKDETRFAALQDGDVYPCHWKVEEPDEGPGNEGWFDEFNQSFEEPILWTPLPALSALEERQS